MQERPGRGGEPEDEYYSKRLAALNGLNGTGKHRVPPQRPSGMNRVEHPPQTTRVARPKRQPPKGLGRGLLILGGILLACTIVACIFGYSLGSNYFTSLGASSGAATTANDFLQSIVKRDYEGAYKDLGGAVTMQLTLEQFEDRAQHDDVCYGVMKSYVEIPNSAVVQGNTQSYAYTIARDKIPTAYQLHLTLQQDLEASNVWEVTSYGGDLGPTASCSK
ncbi:MAG: hypothetical protein NVS4B11_16570 [Ktedonobacteraceae bacterium]